MIPEKDLSTATVVSVKNLCKAFGDHIVLDNFSLELHRGESKVVLGRSGSGKSVFIKCLIGLLEPDEGEIIVLGRNIQEIGHEELDEVRVKVGFLFQSNALYDSMTVRENLEFPMRRHTIELSEEEARERVLEALVNVGLEDTIDMMPAELSGGMQKRIALARTLILKPDIILYDEPTAGLDPITGREITSLITGIKEKYGTASIVISHDMKCVKAVGDKVAVLIEGKCYAEDTYDVLKCSDDNILKQFFE